MMVRYVRERGYKGGGRDPLLTIGKTYPVLGIVFRPAPYAAQVCICTDTDAEDHSTGRPYSDGGPGLFDLNLFDVVDSRVPPDWLMSDHGRGYYRLDPREFAGDFWDRFHDASPEAEKTFEQIIERLKVFHED
jgi:hypothetical protein